MENYEKSTKYFIWCLDDQDNKKKIRASAWATNPDKAVSLAVDYMLNQGIIDLEKRYTLRVRKIRVRDRIDYHIPPLSI